MAPCNSTTGQASACLNVRYAESADGGQTWGSSIQVTDRDGRLDLVHLPAPVDAVIDVWWLQQYAGGLFLPLRDGTAGESSYGGGRYVLDTAKGADLGGQSGRLIIDLNFLYHPSCRYNDAWLCPLAPPGTPSAPR